MESSKRALYSRMVPRTPHRSPTFGLFLGLMITLAAVVAYSWYTTVQISHLRELQRNLADEYRKDSLQLLRIQNDLNSLGLAMRDMLANDEPYPLTAWSAQFEQIHDDLNDALRLEGEFATVRRTPEQIHYLANSFSQFWDAVDRTFSLARNGNDAAAREQIRISLQARQASLTAAVARQLVQNNEGEEQAARQVGRIYDRVQRQVYFFLTAILIAILVTSLYVIRANRRLFAQLGTVSNQRSELAQKLISTQESTLRYISRELHDEFGQVLTAIGSLLSRSEKQIPDGSSLRTDLHEVRDITQRTLDNLRSLSQALHPVMLDEAGLESTLDWYIPTVEKQTGIAVKYEKTGTPFALDASAAVNIYRILQEALNNVARHSGAREAWVRLRYLPDTLELEIEDHGAGLGAQGKRTGIGLVAMRERAVLLNGVVEFVRPSQGGTLVRLRVPRGMADSHVR
ncbi:MAG TPA: sensor histidine kinase [Candidatus Limnocylindrales bacterium]|nr:sensor histidine kinase [Candidatus Limnocylindrales bacterium]